MHAPRPFPSFRHLLLIAVAALGVLLWRWPAADDGMISRWRGALPSGGAELSGEAVAQPQPATTGLLAVAVDDGLYAADRAPLDAELHSALAYVVARFGSTLLAPIEVQLSGSAGCALSGVAYTDIRVVRVQTCDGIARGRAVAILAHEYVHQLQHDRYGPPHLSADLILSEGMATWGAGDYWLGGHPDFRSYVRQQRADGASYPLATHYSGLGIDAMNILYYQWAAFVEFLIDTRGREAFDALYLSGGGAPGSADYLGVYGVGLETLEAEWIAWLEQP
jgi:hypothetical protein